MNLSSPLWDRMGACGFHTSIRRVWGPSGGEPPRRAAEVATLRSGDSILGLYESPVLNLFIRSRVIVFS